MRLKLDKENYEFLMFELLEGNLSKTESKEVMLQINADSFYQKEWVVMQHTVSVPDTSILMPHKKDLLKPVGQHFLFISWPATLKAAASLLLVGIVGFAYYYSNKDGQPLASDINNKPKDTVLNIIPKNLVEERKSQIVKEEAHGQNLLKDYKKDIHPNCVSNDTTKSDYQPEMLTIEPMILDKIAISDLQDEIMNFQMAPSLQLYKSSDLNKSELRLIKGRRVINSVWVHISDVPNLKFKMTPKLKDKKRSIKFEIKGEIIYANALIEIK